MGTFYALAGAARPKLLSWINFVLSSVGVILFVPFLLVVQRGEPTGLFLAMGWAAVLTVIFGMTTFIAAIVVVLFRKPVAV